MSSHIFTRSIATALLACWLVVPANAEPLVHWDSLEAAAREADSLRQDKHLPFIEDPQVKRAFYIEAQTRPRTPVVPATAETLIRPRTPVVPATAETLINWDSLEAAAREDDSSRQDKHLPSIEDSQVKKAFYIEAQTRPRTPIAAKIAAKIAARLKAHAGAASTDKPATQTARTLVAEVPTDGKLATKLADVNSRITPEPKQGDSTPTHRTETVQAKPSLIGQVAHWRASAARLTKCSLSTISRWVNPSRIASTRPATIVAGATVNSVRRDHAQATVVPQDSAHR